MSYELVNVFKENFFALFTPHLFLLFRVSIRSLPSPYVHHMSACVFQKTCPLIQCEGVIERSEWGHRDLKSTLHTSARSARFIQPRHSRSASLVSPLHVVRVSSFSNLFATLFVSRWSEPVSYTPRRLRLCLCRLPMLIYFGAGIG